jgi:hypothetical protein
MFLSFFLCAKEIRDKVSLLLSAPEKVRIIIETLL